MAKRPRMTFPKPLSSLIQESLKGHCLAKRLSEAEIWRVWPDVVGSTVASRAQPLRIIRGTLTVAVSSAPWIQELRFMTDMIREKLNSCLGGEVVIEIVLKAGKIQKNDNQSDSEILPPKPLTSGQLSLVEEQSAVITDLETRRAFEELMKASLEHSRSR